MKVYKVVKATLMVVVTLTLLTAASCKLDYKSSVSAVDKIQGSGKALHDFNVAAYNAGDYGDPQDKGSIQTAQNVENFAMRLYGMSGAALDILGKYNSATFSQDAGCAVYFQIGDVLTELQTLPKAQFLGIKNPKSQLTFDSIVGSAKIGVSTLVALKHGCNAKSPTDTSVSK